MNHRRFRLLPLVLLLLPACQQQMAVQPSARPDEPSSFFPDGRAARPRVQGTVARGHLRIDAALFTGKSPEADDEWRVPAGAAGAAAEGPLAAAAMATARPGKDAPTFPFPITYAVLQHGRNRYTI